MKVLTSLAVVGALAVSAIGATATTASAGGNGWRNGYNPGPQYHQRHRGNNNGGTLAAGAIFGLAVGALAGQAFGPPMYYAPVPTYYPPYPPQPVYYPPVPAYPVYAGPAYGNPDAAWCASQYRSYNAQTNTWVDFQGVVHVCSGPY